MSRRQTIPRRRLFFLCGGLGFAGMSGCLRLAEEEEETDTTSGDGEDTADGDRADTTDGDESDTTDGEATDTSGEEETDTIDREDFDIELVPAWEQNVLFSIISTAGDFFTVPGNSDVSRIHPDGDIVFETDEFDDNYRPTIRSGWRNALFADESGVYVGASPDDDGEGGRIYALDPETGVQRWIYEEPADGLHNNIRAVNSTDDIIVYASMTSGSGSDQEPIVRAVDAQTGGEQWQINFSEEFIIGIFLYENRLFIQQTFELFVYNLETQEQIEVLDTRSGFNLAALKDGTLYMPGDTIQAITLPSGEQQWAADTGYAVNTSPALTETELFVGTESGFVLAYDRETGNQLWQNRVAGSIDHPPIVENDIVWIASGRGDLSAYTTQTGELIYEEPVDPDLDFAIQDGVLVDNVRGTAFEIRRN